MKRLVLAALLLASCAAVPKTAPPPKAPDYVQMFADALCQRDAVYVAANTGGRLVAPEAAIADYFSQLTPCTTARFITTDNGHFLFILHEGDVDVSYLFYFDDARKCVDLQ